VFEGYAAAGVMVVLKRFSYEGGLKLASLERRAGEAQPERRHDRGRDVRINRQAVYLLELKRCSEKQSYCFQNG